MNILFHHTIGKILCIFNVKEFIMEFLVLNTIGIDHIFLLEVRLQYPKNI